MQLQLRKCLAALFAADLLFAELAQPIAALDWFGKQTGSQQQPKQGSHDDTDVETLGIEAPPLLVQQQHWQQQHQVQHVLHQRNLEDVLAIFGGALVDDGEHVQRRSTSKHDLIVLSLYIMA
jgi:hypothetical protein